MIRGFRTLVMAAVLAVVAIPSASLFGHSCQPDVAIAYATHAGEYATLFTTLAPQISALGTGFATVKDQPSYATFLATVRRIAVSIPTGRVVVTLPDGTVMIDTSK